MLPVVDPNSGGFGGGFYDELGIEAVMTNAYLLRRARLGLKPEDVHDTLGFEKTVATDSGAYQILEYGNVAVEPKDIVAYQEEIGADIGVILDVPTGFKTDVSTARRTVDETIRRADEAVRVRTRSDILWVGPIQGGIYPDEIARSAKEMSKRDFAIYALGSPTQVMELQRFELLVEMILSAKRHIPPGKPFHLFGAGHPSIFSFLVALGCDLFDSAAYALYARTGRYITAEGTALLGDMHEFPCPCEACRGRNPREVRRLRPSEREKILSQHNLHACSSELKKIREEIRKGRLWDLLDLRAQAHPALRKCLNRIANYSGLIERYTPIAKTRGIFYFGDSSDQRPEILRFRTKIKAVRPARSKIVLLLPGRRRSPYREDPRYRQVIDGVQNMDRLVVCFYTVPFGPVPLELDETYPVAQTEGLDSIDVGTLRSRASLVGDFVRKLSPVTVFMVREGRYGDIVLREISGIVPTSKIVSVNGIGLRPDRLVSLIETKANGKLGVHSVK
jgi:7-cyano-7-deazaguanine tRNA-ribosyltransferase